MHPAQETHQEDRKPINLHHFHLKNMMVKKKTLLLQLFLVTVVALIIIGFIFIYSASSVFALEKFDSAHHFVKKQFFGLLLGLFAFFFI